ncbi:stage III sporulation protein AH [Desulfitobacterium sp.]|uniref:stage III sporulation protein AH n=1 Tax=Desulfitobacterium sp. TaxID=49981 RepID=UPI002B7D1D1F|nr:stage III sporulation protein AH [Desulfitobacterium sp.]HVJ48912.1 stage III sporulation protein AH [Desulfitobacterium sp.]
MKFFEEISPKLLVTIVAAIAVAVILMLTSKGSSKIGMELTKQPVSQNLASDSTQIGLLEKDLEQKLVQNLQQMNGVGRVQVSVTLSTSLKSDFATSGSVTKKTIKEADKAGGTRESSEVTENNQLVIANGASQPVVVMEERPTVAGVLIIAEGAQNPTIRENIHNAVKTLLDIPTQKITVQPMEGV